jgi:hypothetical protein
VQKSPNRGIITMMVLVRRLALLALASCAVVACSTSNVEPGDGGGDSHMDAPGDTVRPRDATKHDADAAIDGGTPYLVHLSVTAPSTGDGAPGDAGPPLGLVPPFSPTTYDYYVRCADLMNTLTVAMTASPGSESQVVLPNPSAIAPKQTVVMSVKEGQAVVAAATDGIASTQYWVRCLPHDFPNMQMSPHPDAGATTTGYYLIGTQTLQLDQSAYAMILNGDGVPVWYAAQTLGDVVSDVESLAIGEVSYAYPFQVRQFSPPTTTYVTVFGGPPDVHELRLLANGDYLAFITPVRGGLDLTGISLPLPDGGTEAFGPDASIADCDIVELDGGNIVWSWVGSNHFNPVADMTYFAPPEYAADGTPVVDAFHCNSIDVDESGNLLVSSRAMDSVFYIDRSSPDGNVLWKMGGSDASLDKATYVPVADPFYRQHDARLQPSWKATCFGGSGQISLFDDETNMPNPARGIVYQVNIGPSDGGIPADCGAPNDAGVTGATTAWQYKGNASTYGTGSFRILADGSRIIGWGSNVTVAFTEVSEGGQDLLDFHFTDGNSTYRAIKVPLSTFDLDVLRSSAGF